MSLRRLRWPLLALMVGTTGCPDDPTPADDGGTETDASTGTGDPSSESTGALADGTTTAATDSTGTAADTTSTGMVDDTASDTTGEPAGDGRIRVLLGTGGRLGAGFVTLSILTYDAGAQTDVAVNEPLADDRVIANWGVSPAGGYIYFRTAGVGSDDDRAFLARYEDGQTDAAVRYNGPPAPDPGLGGNPVFTEDDRALVFFAAANNAGEDPTMWISGTDEGAPDAPIALHPALGPGDDINFEANIGPADAGVVVTGDFTGGNLNNLHLASSDPDDAGTVTQLSAHTQPEQGVAFASSVWTPDGSAVLYRADADIDAVNELWWVGLGGAMPSAPTKINDPLIAGQTLLPVRVSSDSRAVVYWAGTGSEGNVFVSYLDAAMPTAPVVVSSLGNDQAFPNSLIWAPDGGALIYTGQHDTAGNRDAYYVDMSGAMPGQPERINGELISGGQVMSIVFGPTGEFLYYVAPQDQAGAELYRARLIDRVPGIPEKVSGPLTDGGNLSGEIIFAPDGSALLYTGNAEDAGQQELFMVPLVDGELGEVLKVNPDLNNGTEVQFATRFSDDSSALIYRTRADGDEALPLWLEDLTDGLANPILLADAVQGYRVLPLR